MKVSLYDKVKLKDGRTAIIVDVLEDGVAYIADVNLPNDEWETIDIKFDDIDKII